MRSVKLAAAALAVVSSVASPSSAAIANSGTAYSPILDVRSGATGVAICDLKGVYDNGRITAEVAGVLSASGAVVAVGIKCEVIQYGWPAIVSEMALPGTAAATAKTGTLDAAPAQVCVSGFYMVATSSVPRPIARQCR